MQKLTRFVLISSCVTLLACEVDDKDIQPGTRVSLEEVTKDKRSAASEKVLLGAIKKQSWPQHLGNTTHETINASFDGSLNLIGRYSLTKSDNADSATSATDAEGGTISQKLKVISPPSFLRFLARKSIFGASTPIIVGGRIYHYDSAGWVHAISSNGSKIWSKSLIPVGFSTGDGFGGGVAYSDGKLYVSTGYGEVVALNASTGERLWSYVQKAPIHKAPIVSNGMVVIVSEGANAVGMSAATGQVVWRHFADPSNMPTRFNAGVPAARDGKVMVAYASGSVAMLNIQSGEVIWEKQTITDLLSGSKSVFSDITGDPVFVGNQVIVGTASGIISFSVSTGEMLWTQDIGTRGPLIVSGNSVIGITQRNTMFRLSLKDGAIGYKSKLPRDEVDEFGLKFGKRSYGDVRLAGGAIWSPTTRKEIARINPASGKVSEFFPVEDNFAIAPVVAEGLMVTVTEGGDILIYR